jgi:tetratricopeptide (TPR) repeat protein
VARPRARQAGARDAPHPDGRLVGDPIATVEEQAYHWIALQRMAEILVATGDEAGAGAFASKARALGARWHDAFWMPDEGFYAMALDGDKRQVRSMGSNAGHALAAGLVPREHARACADRLLAGDLFSGWGVRTLSREHPSYNPLAYHLGTVWPVENATFALGFKRYGLDDHLERLAEGLADAAAHFQNFRLPEAIGGLSREQSPIPSLYPQSTSPQAWSASAVIQLVQPSATTRPDARLDYDRSMRTLLLLTLVLGAAAPARAQDLGAARRLFDAGKYQDAINAVAGTPASAPDWQRFVFLEGQARERLADTSGAERAYMRLTASPNAAWQAVGQAATFVMRKDAAQATAAAGRAVAANANLPEAQFELGLAQSLAGDYGAAAAALDKASMLDPMWAPPRYYAGLAYAKIKRVDLLAARFQAFLNLAPQAPERGEVESIMRTIRGR